MIDISSVGMDYSTPDGPRRVLEEVNLRVEPGEFMSIVGPSGVGKTTLLRIVGGLLDPTQGTVRINGLSPREGQARKELGLVLQEPSLLPWRTVEENVRLPLEVNPGGKDSSDLLEEMLELVRLTPFRRYRPWQLSGGMKQRVALARALVFNPSILLMDEPLGSLDEISRRDMGWELLDIWQRTSKTVLLVTHSVTEAVALSDRVAILNGTPARIGEIVSISLPRPRHEEVEENTRFQGLVNLIKRHLRGSAPYKATAIPYREAR